MRRTALVVAVVGIMGGAAWAAPTYEYTAHPVGGGLYGFTFTCDNPGEPASAWFVEMKWWGMTQAEVDQHCQCCPGAIPGTIIQDQVFGVVDVHCETEAIVYHNPSPPADYDMNLDTWIKAEFCDSCQSGTPIEGLNSFEADCGTAAGMQYVTVGHAYVVADGSFAYEGRLGVGAVNPVWTPVSGYICFPEPSSAVLLVLGMCAMLRRRSQHK